MPVLSPEDARRFLTDISDRPDVHKLQIANVVKQYRRLGKWMKNNADHLGAHLAVSAVYTMGVVGRALELSGHRLVSVTDAEIDVTAQQVIAAVPDLLPLDAGLNERLAAIPWLAQPAILAVLIEDLFAAEPKEGAPPREVLFQVFVLVWVAVEVLATAAESD